MISVQHKDFDQNEEYEQLVCAGASGAIVTFVGRVRDFANNNKSFELQHYPGMTENVLEAIEQEATKRWSLLSSKIIHRVGKLKINDQIVFIGTSSAHRRDAFAACEYMIDILKTQAPFWKKQGGDWVAAQHSDQEAAQSWLKG